MQRKQRKACVRPRNHSPSVRLGHVCTHQSSQLSKSEESKKEKQGQQSRQSNERNRRKQREHAPPPYTSNPSPAESPATAQETRRPGPQDGPNQPSPVHRPANLQTPSGSALCHVSSNPNPNPLCSITPTHTTHHHHGPHQRRPLIGPLAAVSPRCRDTAQATPPRFTQQHQDPAKPAFGRASTARLASGTRGAREAEQTKDDLDVCVCVCVLLCARRKAFFSGSHTAVRACVSRLTRAPPLLAMPCHAMTCRPTAAATATHAGWLAG
jgi:hypothetical protein